MRAEETGGEQLTEQQLCRSLEGSQDQELFICHKTELPKVLGNVPTSQQGFYKYTPVLRCEIDVMSLCSGHDPPSHFIMVPYCPFMVKISESFVVGPPPTHPPPAHGCLLYLNKTVHIFSAWCLLSLPLCLSHTHRAQLSTSALFSKGTGSVLTACRWPADHP